MGTMGPRIDALDHGIGSTGIELLRTMDDAVDVRDTVAPLRDEAFRQQAPLGQQRAGIGLLQETEQRTILRLAQLMDRR